MREATVSRRPGSPCPPELNSSLQSSKEEAQIWHILSYILEWQHLNAVFYFDTFWKFQASIWDFFASRFSFFLKKKKLFNLDFKIYASYNP